MPLFKPKNPPNTISDSKWKVIQTRARNANPDLDDLCSPRGIARRKLFAEQHDKRTQS